MSRWVGVCATPLNHLKNIYDDAQSPIHLPTIQRAEQLGGASWSGGRNAPRIVARRWRDHGDQMFIITFSPLCVYPTSFRVLPHSSSAAPAVDARYQEG